jgi:hypothetical protein
MRVIAMYMIFNFMDRSRPVGKGPLVAGRDCIGMEICDKYMAARHTDAG